MSDNVTREDIHYIYHVYSTTTHDHYLLSGKCMGCIHIAYEFCDHLGGYAGFEEAPKSYMEKKFRAVSKLYQKLFIAMHVPGVHKILVAENAPDGLRTFLGPDNKHWIDYAFPNLPEDGQIVITNLPFDSVSKWKDMEGNTLPCSCMEDKEKKA